MKVDAKNLDISSVLSFGVSNLRICDLIGGWLFSFLNICFAKGKNDLFSVVKISILF